MTVAYRKCTLSLSDNLLTRTAVCDIFKCIPNTREDQTTMQEAFVMINDVPTHIMTWGKWIEESFTNEKEVIICITGNPGLPGYYTKFLSTLHNNLNQSIPIWLIGHAGHDEPPKSSIRKVPPLSGNESKFNLDGQIKHKIEFIEKYVPKNVKIHLIGHSIGAWMTIQMLKQTQLKERIQKCYLLFPTIERMAASPNGKFCTTLVFPLYPILAFLTRILNLMPTFIRVLLISIYFWVFNVPRYFMGTTLKYLRPTVIESVVFLAKEEMQRVRELDAIIINDNKKLLKFFYGTTDGWVPVSYYDNLRQAVQGVDAVLDDQRIDHSFVLRQSVEVADKVGNWIQLNRVHDIAPGDSIY